MTAAPGETAPLLGAEAGKPAKKRSVWGFLLRLAVSAALLTYLLFIAVPPDDLGKIVTLMIDSDVLQLTLALCCVLADRLISAWKWLILLRVRQPELPAMQVLQVLFISTFLGYFLPSSVGGDALRTYSLSRINKDLAGNASSVVIDRAYGIFGLLAISAIMLPFALGTFVPLADAAVIWAAAAAALVGVILLSSRRVHRLFSHIAGLETGGFVRRKIAKLVGAAIEFVDSKVTLLKAFSLSLVVQILRILLAVYCGAALGIEIDLLHYFIAMPIIAVVALLPLSIAGFGVREAAFIYFFTRAGVPAYACLSLSLLYFAMGIIVMIPGALIFAVSGFGRRLKASGES